LHTKPQRTPLLEDLNPQQREAVQATEGPVLVLAGAGSGKTRVITYRIAHLIAQGVPARNILAVTFTNKAAEQMKLRVESLLGAWHQGEPWISTFHSFCARLLRGEAPRLNLPRTFTIYDEDDQAAAVKLALKQIGDRWETQGWTPRGLLERISFAKNHGMTVADMRTEWIGAANAIVPDVFELYQETLRKAAALDFDDLLLRAVEVLEQFPEARANWQAKFRHLQVDEFQDTNYVQYKLLRLLTGEPPNLCVVGDEDQSIYGWRGAEVGNILRFAEDFPGTRVFRLEENYRSTQPILDAAGAVVAHNIRRLGKTLRATRGGGRRLRYFEAQDAAGEAEYVTGEIVRLLREEPDAHLAVLYRTNFQSRSFEDTLRPLDVRYRVVGGFSFYRRAEVKDALAYLRLLLHPDDDVALLRVVNTPPRGIGKTTIEALRAAAQQRGTSLWAAIPEMSGGPSGRKPLLEFRRLIESLRAEAEKLPPAELLNEVLDCSGYLMMAEVQDESEGTARSENLRELVNAIAESTERGESLADFLDRMALVSDADEYDEHAQVSLMTLHSAKGLEFEHVFLVGLEEGLFPHSRSLSGEGDLEEERRLCYVGMTRAKNTLTLTRAVFRRAWGNEGVRASTPSRFLSEIPGELIETAKGSLADAGETRRYESDVDYYEAERVLRRRAAASRSAAAPKRARPNPLLGMRVRHPKYGVGTILSVEGEDDERKFTVSFPGYGTKRLLERYARLEPA
jgi:DNA helicase-2/ATP-dependent DNA helicase PcrA